MILANTDQPTFSPVCPVFLVLFGKIDDLEIELPPHVEIIYF